jgi:hypothetical protein
MDRIYPNIRLTHRYVGTCAHLDQWGEAMVSLKATPAKLTARPGPDADMSEGASFTRHIRLPAGLSPKQKKRLIRGLEDSMSRWNCHHEWDCCGCASWTTRVTVLNARDLLVRTSYSYNY